eukprot:scaffold222937_cov31-Prasinocladus_malaysianus.AAC.1
MWLIQSWSCIQAHASSYAQFYTTVKGRPAGRLALGVLAGLCGLSAAAAAAKLASKVAHAAVAYRGMVVLAVDGMAAVVGPALHLPGQSTILFIKSSKWDDMPLAS